jgi:hypothetical protein
MAGNLSGQDPERHDRDQRRRQRRDQEAERTDRLFVEVALEDGEPGRVGRVGDDGQAAAGDRPGDEGVFEGVVDALDQRAEVRSARRCR